jgi:dipeptidyl aminopeptidase/acylaminoacyl peptidase
MRKLIMLPFLFSFIFGAGQTSKENEEMLLKRVLADPSPREIKEVLDDRRHLNLSPEKITIHDSVELSNSNKLYVLSHSMEGRRHYGAVIIPRRPDLRKFPVVIFATGGDGMHTQFDLTQDFNHKAVQFPHFLGGSLDSNFIIVIPSFRGQQLIIGDKKYQSEGPVADAFDGAATDALAFLNVSLETFTNADVNRIMIYGGSRGGTVALLAASRDKRIKRAVVVAAPSDMKQLYKLYPDQFKLLFFNDLLTGKISESEARKKFIACSPIHFAHELPPVQFHHDNNDPFVPAELAKSLVVSMQANKKDVIFYSYNEGIHGFWNDDKYWKRVQEFTAQLLREK